MPGAAAENWTPDAEERSSRPHKASVVNDLRIYHRIKAVPLCRPHAAIMLLRIAEQMLFSFLGPVHGERDDR